jgi:hypothetical protein
MLRGLIRRLSLAFPDTPPYSGLFFDPTPHLTVAAASTEVELDRIEGEVRAPLGSRLPLEIEVRELAVQEEGEGGR